MHPPPANILSPELRSLAQNSSPARVLLRLGVSLPEVILQKDHHLRPRRLRRNTVAGKSTSSGQHSLPEAELAGASLFSGKGFPPVRGFPAGGNHPKNHYLRPRRLRRSSADRNASSSGEHSLAGTELAGTTLFSGKGSPPGRGCCAGGKHPKTSSLPTTAASPKFSLRQRILLRRKISRRN